MAVVGGVSVHIHFRGGYRWVLVGVEGNMEVVSIIGSIHGNSTARDAVLVHSVWLGKVSVSGRGVVGVVVNGGVLLLFNRSWGRRTL